MYLNKEKRINLESNIAWLEQKIRRTDEDYHHQILEPEVVLNFLKSILED